MPSDGLGDDVRLAPKRFKDRDEAERVLGEMRGARWVVADVGRTLTKAEPSPTIHNPRPVGDGEFSTWGFRPRRHRDWPSLYSRRGPSPSIRTDSTALADDAVLDIRSYLGAHHGKLLPDEPIRAPLAAGAQAAHEAIRPTKMTRVPRAEMGLGGKRSLRSGLWQNAVLAGEASGDRPHGRDDRAGGSPLASIGPRER